MGQVPLSQCANEQMPQVRKKKKDTNTTHDVWPFDDNQNLDV